MNKFRFGIGKLMGVVGASLVLVLLIAPGAALAHERRTIGNGAYDVVVGWANEPTYVGMSNGATIRIMQAGTTTPVTGADKTLKLAIRQGASTQPFPLRAVFGQDGFYTADVVPTRVGDYQWIFTGTIGDTPINETFDTADGKFDGAKSASAIQFPVQLGDPGQDTSAVQSAQADAQGARTLAMVAIAVGIIGVIVGVIGLGMAMRRGGAREIPTGSTVHPASERV
jgi:hypothetical protein